MDGNDFIEVASELAKAKTQAHWRSAVSRAYYGAFHVTKDVLSKRGVFFSKGSAVHGEVHRKLINDTDKDVSSAGSLLANLHSNRIRCDYELTSHTTLQNNATLDVWAAKTIRDCIRKHFQPRRQQQ